MYSVYALSDPRTNEVRYVGSSNNMKRRYAQHVSNRDRSNCIKQAWIDELRAQGLRPTLIILDKELEKPSALIRERYWLQWYVRQEARLTNMRDIERCDEECWVPMNRKNKY